MRTQDIFRIAVLAAIWLLLVWTMLARAQKFTLMTLFWIVASGIIVFVPLYKKYIKKH